MEGSVAAGGDAGASQQGAEGQGAAEGQQQAPGVDFSGLDDHIGKALDSRFESFGEQLNQQLAPLLGDEGDGEQYMDDPESFGLDPSEYQDEEGNISPEAADAYLQDMIGSRVQQGIQQAVAPLMEQVQTMNDSMNARALVEQYPDLAQREVGEAAVSRLTQTGQEMGLQGEDMARFVTSPAMVRLAYLAGKAEQGASGEPAEGRSELGLESGAAAGQGSASPNIGREIVGAGGPKGFWS